MVTFTLNGQELEVKEGTTLLEVAREQGINIPTLCYHEEMSSYGACRLCLVEVVRRGWPSIQPACLYPAREGIEVNTDTERVRKTRKNPIDHAEPRPGRFCEFMTSVSTAY